MIQDDTVVIVFLVLLALGGSAYLYDSRTTDFKVGDCLEQIDPDREDWHYKSVYRVEQVGKKAYRMSLFNEFNNHWMHRADLSKDDARNYVRTDCPTLPTKECD